MLNLEFLRSNIKADKISMLENSNGKLGVTSLLGSNTKLEKSNAIITGLTLAPFKLINTFDNGTNVNYCANGKDCFSTCLFNQSGRYGFKGDDGFSTAQKAGIKRALYYKNRPDRFFRLLSAEIESKVANIEDNQKLYIRLNVMSDINFSDYKKAIFKKYNGQVVFYDYTKISDNLLNNTNMALSMTKKGLSLNDIKTVLKTGSKISAIVSKEDKKQLISEFPKLCIDGDKHDLFFKEQGLFTLLAPKGLSNKQKSDLDRKMVISYRMVKNIIKIASTGLI